MATSRLQTTRLAFIASIIFFIYITSTFLSSRNPISSPTLAKWNMHQQEQQHQNPDLARTGNRTLGFQKVYAIGLRERSDKRDAMALMAALTEFEIEWFDGVKPSDIPETAVPFGIDIEKVKDNFLGSWRGHMNVIRHIVENDISSALIMEDDLDWDINLKSQLHSLALGTRHIYPLSSSSSSSQQQPNSPYGDDWDLLWLGHCGEPFPETLSENSNLDPSSTSLISDKYFIHDDPTVPPYDQVSRLVDWSAYSSGTRIVHVGAAPICSFAYALSQRGARKVLHGLSVAGLHMAFDNSLAQMCRNAAFDRARNGGEEKKERYGGFKCVSVNPTMMFHHRPRGRISGDSDIQSYGGSGGVRDKGVTESVVYSVRLNLENLLAGRPVEAQFGGN